MLKNTFLLLSFLLFVLGAFVFVFIYFLLTSGKTLSSTNTFSRFSDKVPSLVIVWSCVVLYIFFSILVVILLNNAFIPMKVALSVQAVLLFFFATIVYFGYFANYRVSAVAKAGTELKQNIMEMRSLAQLLTFNSSSLPSQYDELRKKIKQIEEDLRYLSPVGEGRGDALEKQIIEKIKTAAQYCSAATEGAVSPGFAGTVAEIQILLKERKLLRNA